MKIKSYPNLNLTGFENLSGLARQSQENVGLRYR